MLCLLKPPGIELAVMFISVPGHHVLTARKSQCAERQSYDTSEQSGQERATACGTTGIFMDVQSPVAEKE